jgi:CHAT domain-containing protein/tetratricopeptide (TPR) repeat protein
MLEVSRGGVVVEGARESEKRRWNLLPTFQGMTVTPLLSGALAQAYQSARALAQAGDSASAGKELGEAAQLADQSHCVDAALWLQAQAAQLRATARQWPGADAGFEKALARARELALTHVEVHLQMSWSEALLRRGDFGRAKQQFEGALRLEEQEDPDGLGVSTLLTRLGNVADRQDDLDEEGRLYRRAYELALRAAPGSGAEAAGASNLSLVAGKRGDFAQAERYIARALAIREKLTPSGDAILPSLIGYGNVLYARGDLAGAEAAFLRAKRILERVQPESNALAITLHDLGEIAQRRGDDDAAENLFRRELALFEKIDPSSQLVRDSLVGLGRVALQRHQADKAEEAWQRALAISEKLNPKGPKSAACLGGLAEVAKLQGRGAEAESLFQRALGIWQEINPESGDAGSLHLKLGVLLLEQGRTKAAEAHLRTAIRVQEKSGGAVPEPYQALARLQARRGQAKEAAATYRAAVNALEAQRGHLGGPKESQWRYGSSLGDLYVEAAEHQLALGRPLEAWRLVERGRARGFQEMLAQRDLRFESELPAPLYAERRRLAAEYDRAQAALSRWVPEQGTEKLVALQGRLRDLRTEQAANQEQIQRSSPRLGSLESLAPLDLATARSALDPGTVLLTYSVGESRSLLFLLESEGRSGPGLFVYPLAIGREDLAKEVDAFRSLLAGAGTDHAALIQRGRHLYDLLLRPAKPMLARAHRWVLSPDGPLHSLPFAALVSGDRYLAESKPIHIAASAAVYKEIKAARSKRLSPTPTELLAVGDPLYPARIKNQEEATADPQIQTALRRGFQLEPLPASRGEVQAISHLFPGARTLLGGDASEEAIKALAPQARRLHLACHGLLDERFPLNSALALSIPEHPEAGRDNGLLQAWEIFESLRLDADLVTLSACDTGLGKEMGGEGLVGLVRAFQYAGARSVLASLWSVEDASTAELMKRFYGYLQKGRSKDEALRAAQVDLIRSKSGSSHPFHWAAFELFGDWR